MKIAHLTECLTDNGVTTVIRNLTAGFREAGHQVDIITWRPSAIHDPGLLQIRLQGLGNTSSSFTSRLVKGLIGSRLWQYSRAKLFCSEFLAQVDFDTYDAVLIHGLACIPLWRLPASAIIVAHSTKSRMLLRSRQFVLKPILRFLYSRMYRSHPVICVSQGSRDDMLVNFGVDPQQVTAIYNPFPVEEIRRKSREPISDVPDVFVLAVGRPVKSKRFDRLMRVYKLSGIDAPLVVLVGSGKASKVDKLARRYGISEKVKVIGHRENPYPYMARARALILTSDYEGLPTVLIESLICGTAVVSSDCPSGPSEILVGNLARCLVPPTDEWRMAKVLKSVFDDEQSVCSLSFDEFSQKTAVLKYCELLRNLNE
ncbi:glycosyltransferase [Geopsychrobacter electrodiphilus]|uniref:glycosyltransferase n=1 Tax=Geopsychrobacter electrodiphilus TaxID=225196 RepID=UPI00036D4C45|nr:glycosyltransferase [Geopsychrobacter electrodiphilus]